MVIMSNRIIRRFHPALDGLKKFDDPNSDEVRKALEVAKRKSKQDVEGLQAGRLAVLAQAAGDKLPYVHNYVVQNAPTLEAPLTQSEEDAEQTDVDQSGITTKELV